MSSPTKRTLAHYRDRGFVAEVVERYNKFSKRRHDLFGFVDIVAIRPVEPEAIVAVQCTSQSHAANRIQKIKTECRDNARAWLNAGGLIHVVGWRRLVVRRKDGSKAKRKRWEPRIETVTLEDLA